MGATSGAIDKDGYEKQWATAAARQNLSQEDRLIWNESRYTIRPYVYHDKILIAWSYANGEPVIKDIFTVQSVEVSFQDGVWLKLVSEVNRRETIITHTPRRLPDLKIFGWVPFFLELRFASADWDNPALARSLRMSACFKMMGKPDVFVANQDFLTELHVFRDMFPKYQHTRF